jgi:hypothetical protein
MHFDHVMSTMEGRHLVFAYAAVFLIQAGYAITVARAFLRAKSPH